MKTVTAADKFWCVLGVGLFVFVIGFNVCALTNNDVLTATVTGKTVKRVSESSDRYLVFTENETFQIRDSLWYGQFSSSDLYGKLRDDQSYQFKVYGFRIPFLSSYRTIYSVDRTDSKSP